MAWKSTMRKVTTTHVMVTTMIMVSIMIIIILVLVTTAPATVSKVRSKKCNHSRVHQPHGIFVLNQNAPEVAAEASTCFSDAPSDRTTPMYASVRSIRFSTVLTFRRMTAHMQKFAGSATITYMGTCESGAC